MSVTTLANPVTTTLSRTLADYEIHLTGDDVHGHIAAQNARDDTVDTNPAHWLQNRRRIPPRRPINRDLDPDERPNGMNAFETTFLRIMFTGVATVAATNQLWRQTGGKINDTFWRYQIGGEW